MSQKIDVFNTIAITARIILAKSFSYFFTVYFVHCSFITNTRKSGLLYLFSRYYSLSRLPLTFRLVVAAL